MNKLIFNPVSRSVLSLTLVFILIFSASAPALADDYNFDFSFDFDFNFDFDFDFSGLDGLSGGTTAGTTDSSGLYWSDYDLSYLNSNEAAIVENAKKDYGSAQTAYLNATTDAARAAAQAAMDAAHTTAEAVRAGSSGNYSGGGDGSEYIPLGNGGSYDGGYVGVIAYTISASAGTGGNISPSGSTSVASGGSQTYTITAAAGYMISDIAVDGVPVGEVSSYTFSNVASAHSISATFASAASVIAGNATLGDGGSGTLKLGNVTKSGYGVTAILPVTAAYVSDTTVIASYNFKSTKTVSLEYVNGTWQFPVSSGSVKGARKIYIPVETKDGTYAITFTIKALDPQATALAGHNVYLTTTKSVNLTIKGSMYEDDTTGDS